MRYWFKARLLFSLIQVDNLNSPLGSFWLETAGFNPWFSDQIDRQQPEAVMALLLVKPSYTNHIIVMNTHWYTHVVNCKQVNTTVLPACHCIANLPVVTACIKRSLIKFHFWQPTAKIQNSLRKFSPVDVVRICNLETHTYGH